MNKSYWLPTEPEKKTFKVGRRWKGGDTEKSVSENGVTTTRTEASTTGNRMIPNILPKLFFVNISIEMILK